jgi:DUF4097 and DUF4098 domain-containing protein YvlB
MKILNISKKVILFMVLVFLLWVYPGALRADEDWNREKFQEKFQKAVDLEKDGHVYLSNISGDIQVKSWSENSVKIEAIKVSQASTSQRAKENADRVQIEVEKVGKTLRIETKFPKSIDRWFSGSMNVSVDYWIWIPEQASIEIKTVSGDIKAEGLGGLFEANAVSGDITVKKVDKGMAIETVSGDLELDDINGDADLETVSGEIVLNRIKGSVDAETVSGEIELREISMARDVEAKTVSGDITYHGDINPQGRYTLKTHSGDVELMLPADAGFELEAETYSGHIDCDFKVSVTGRIKSRQISGTVNQGGALLRLTTFSGSITIEKR